MSTTLLVLSVLILLGIVIFQISKANEYIASLKGADQANDESDSINGKLYLAFLFLFFGGIIWSLYDSWDKMILTASSMHGKWIDSSFNITTLFTAIIFVACHVMLFYFAYKYRGKKGKVAYYYPENNKLEMWWTIIPAIVLTVLIVFGLYNWFRITGPAPADAKIVEITGKQFNWMVRYPGTDGLLGKKEFKLIDETNVLGVNFSDPNSRDDFMTNEIHFEVGKPVVLKIGSRDVIHNVGMPHFRVKMDAVPGIPTTFWLVPTETTDEMRAKTGNPDFVYELACDYLCGKGHSAMRLVIFVDTPEQYQAWVKKQQSFYDTQIKGSDLEKKFALNLNATPVSNTNLSSLNP
jgi:cytochrome c oxidase subunit 2